MATHSRPGAKSTANRLNCRNGQTRIHLSPLPAQCASHRGGAILLPCAAVSVSQPFDTLSQWLSDNGGSMGSITAGACQMGDVTVRGLVACQDLPSNTPIISVPISSTLRDDKAADAYAGAPWNANLAAYLLEERRKGSNSRIWPYLATLPTSCCSPLLLPEHALQEVQYPPAIAAVASYQESVRESYDSWCAARDAAGLPLFAWQDWSWALHMVQSRSIRLAITGCKVMIPGIDLLNHGGAAANGQLVLGKASWQVEGEPAVCFVTTQPIAAGQQVLWSYGTRGNDDFFVYHGFVLPANPDEDAVLFQDVQQLVGWAVQQLPQLQGLRQQQQWTGQQLTDIADAAAIRASQEAAARCSSAAIQGTSSSLLLPPAALAKELQQAGSSSSSSSSSRVGVRQQQQQQQKALHSSGACESAVLAALRNVQLQRRLASCRLHSREWGTSACPPSVPELVLRCDGCVDVRLPAVLAALLDVCAAAAAAGHGDTASCSSDEQGPAGTDALPGLLMQLVQHRCQELLQAYPSSIEQDEQWLQQQAGSSSSSSSSEQDWLMTAVVQYRRGKKQLLQAWLEASRDAAVV